MARLPEHDWVRDAAALRELASQIGNAGAVALDTESNSMFVYRERVCLIQLNVEGHLWLIDTLALAGPDAGSWPDALAPLAEALGDPRLLVWIHGGEYDVACLKRDFGISLTTLFDTQRAASFLGWQRTGYAAVVEELCGIALGKQHTQHDWGQRPIAEDALAYALDDVVHLPSIGAELRHRIALAQLDEELELSNRSVADTPAHQNTFELARMWRLDGVQQLRGDRLGLLAALYAWRDRKGRELDMPPGRLIANAPLVLLAAHAPTDAAALRRVRLRGAFMREHADELLAIIDAGLREPPEVPALAKRNKPSAAQAKRAAALKQWRREEAQRRELPMHVILPPRALDYLVEHGGESLADCPELGAKRIESYGATLASLCATRA
jgi:ribonuclease D